MDFSIVIPVYNEEETLPILFKRLDVILPDLKEELNRHNPTSKDAVNIEVIFVNDGSTDKSTVILDSVVKKKSGYRHIKFSRNFGHQPAVSAGIYYAKGKAVAIMDCDLQDPPELLKEMVKKWQEGSDVVYAVRRKRDTTAFKETAYKLYYRFKSLISDFPVQKDSGDFSLMDRKVVDVIKSLPEKERYIRGLRSWVGFRQTELPYDRIDRKHGSSKYSFVSLFKLASNGILSTSVKPLFLSGFFSAFSMLTILCIIIFSLFSKLILANSAMPKGWTSLIVTISVLSGFQLISLWLLSLYIARMYREILSRPAYIVASDSLETEKREEQYVQTVL